MQFVNRITLFTCLSAAACISVGASSNAGAVPSTALPNSRRQAEVRSRAQSYRADFDQILQLVRDRFHDSKLNGVDWNAIGAAYRAKLAEVKSKSEFQVLINRMIGELHASHAGYFTDDDVDYYMMPAVMRQDMTGHRTEHIGVMGSQEGGEFLVAGVLEGGPADKAGILSGDRLVMADGAPFRSAGSFRGKESRPVEVQYKRANEQSLRSVAITPVRQNILRAFLDATESSARVLIVGGKRIGYIHLWTMANDSFRQALENLVVRRLHDTDGLILDLRDGFGGMPWNYADVFFRPDVTWEQKSRGSGLITRNSGYNKPVVALINHGTRSAKEFFSYELKITRRATLVGTKTAGAFLGAGTFDVGSDGLLELPVLGLKLDGKLLEGNGITPDIVVAPKLTYTDGDTQLLAGQRALLDAITSGGRPAPPGRISL